MTNGRTETSLPIFRLEAFLDTSDQTYYTYAFTEPSALSHQCHNSCVTKKKSSMRQGDAELMMK